MTRLSTLVLVALALLAAGCGGTGPDSVVRDYFDAIVEQDGERACHQLTKELRRDIERAPAARASGRSCADVMELAAGLNPQLSTQDVKDLDIAIKEDGDRAVATLENPLARRRESIDLVQVDGDWRIATLETRPRG